ncbi:hypothetical protein B0H14DRAFT_3898789 [Mycena olivaceomarginata]|nr:hypothetical protein B0H14DRAFT_3898789 [Mycena olivaceomarginata]
MPSFFRGSPRSTLACLTTTNRIASTPPSIFLSARILNPPPSCRLPRSRSNRPFVTIFVLNSAPNTTLKRKPETITARQRRILTVEDLLGYLDQEDADLTGAREFLDVLIRCTPALKPLQKDIEVRLEATAKISAPSGPAIVHPLACNGRKQTIPTELKDAMIDFLQQIGQTPECYLRRKLPVGGDGPTYAMLQQLHIYHHDPFKSFEIMEPQLQKVEFYSGTQSLYLVLDAKIMDIWRLAFETEDILEYFDCLEKTGTLPDFETLLAMARRLYRSLERRDQTGS